MFQRGASVSAPSKRDERRARLELQLRENLKRRKDQARARRDEDAQTPAEAPKEEGEDE